MVHAHARIITCQTRRHASVTHGMAYMWHVGGLTTPTLAPVGGADGHQTSAQQTASGQRTGRSAWQAAA